PEQLTGDAAVQRDIIRKMGVPHSCFHQDVTEGEAIQWSKWNGIIDCLLGTGTKGEPREPFAALIHEMNSSGLPIVSADIPSGLNADTGEMPGACVRASLTVALSQYKRGLLLYPGAEAAGEVVVRSIGIPDHIISSAGVNT
ncbi:NAD(P)H-hydrate epimerase, partial [Clostridium perfringens]|nr:NAD(P)H-hydrate epimerase [Clostridium perfringens]